MLEINYGTLAFLCMPTPRNKRNFFFRVRAKRDGKEKVAGSREFVRVRPELFCFETHRKKCFKPTHDNIKWINNNIPETFPSFLSAGKSIISCECRSRNVGERNTITNYFNNTKTTRRPQKKSSCGKQFTIKLAFLLALWNENLG